MHYSYTYNNNASVTSLTDHIDTNYSISNFAYDGAGRLTATTGGTGIGSSTMRYDGLDNITYYKNKKHTLDYTYSAINRLQSVASSGVESKPYSLFAYDDRGNITHNSYHDFIYNRANQLVESGGNVYTYDAYNRRVVTKQGAKTTYSFYSQSGKLFYTETGGAGINYIYLGSRLIAKDGVIPENGNKQHYLPFGASIEGEINDVGYTGHKFDKDIGLSYMQARYYDPVIGRFMSPDPIGSADQFNLFAYVGNDPVNMTDPTGMYGRGEGWTEKQWKQFDKAQKAAAGKMESKATRLEKQAAKLDKKGKDGGDNLRTAASNLREGAKALRSDGSDGKLAYAGSTSAMTWSRKENVAAFVDGAGGNTVVVNLGHDVFKAGGNILSRELTHESLHTAGLSDWTRGKRAYCCSGEEEHLNHYNSLTPEEKVNNPDYLKELVW